MSAPRRPGSSSPRILWVVAAAALVVLVGVTYLLAGGSLDRAQAEAEERAQHLVVTGLSTETLTPELVSQDILGPAQRELLSFVRVGLMQDPRVTRVRIWTPTGDLIFSTALRDDVEEFAAVGHPQIGQAADGQTVSTIAEATAAPLAGLEGSEEDLFVTYVPLRFVSEEEPLAVVEIDQRHAVITEEAHRVWVPVRIGLLVGLGGLGVLFAVTRRRGRSARRSGWGERPPRVTRDERKVRDLEDRAFTAERATQEAERRLATAEDGLAEATRRLEEAEKAEVAPAVRARLDELELAIRAEKAEREQFAGEVKRLRSALSEKEAELALARHGTASTAAESVRWVDTVRRAEQQTIEAEKRAASAGALAAEAEARRTDAESTVAGLQAALATAERRIAAAVKEAEEAAKASRREDDVRSAAELRTAQLKVNELELKLAETEALLEGSEARRAESEGAAAELEKIRSEAGVAAKELAEARQTLEETRKGSEAARAEAETARAEAETARAEAETARAGLAATMAEAEVSKAGLEQQRAEVDRLRGELERTEADLQRARSDAEAPVHSEAAAPEVAQNGADAERLAELETLVARMEAQRREEIGELHRAQETLANTQLELIETDRKLRAAEERAIASDGTEPVRGNGAVESRGGALEEDDMAWLAEAVEVPATQEPRADEDAQTDQTELPAEETLSLRERLARAAAARHRTTQLPD